MAKKYEINMCEGPLFSKLIAFALPLMLSSILQLLYNAADVIVVGQFAGHAALAAVSSTGSLVNLIVNLFIGLSVGANVATARFFGAKDDRSVHETVHTSMLLSIIGGIGVGIIGFFGARTFLLWMGSPDDVIDLAALYLKIYFVGMPASMVYNFGASILRAIGDTRRPMRYLMISGAVNVVLNLVLVIFFDMSVAGVAIGTVASQLLSAIFVVYALVRGSEGSSFQLFPHKMRIYRDKLVIILQTGIPSGIQGSVFSLSNVLIQSTINSFGSVAMAGNGAAANIEGFIYVAMNAFHHAALTFTSQNLGAHNLARIKRIFWQCILLVTSVGFILGCAALFFGPQLLSIYDSDPQVISFGIVRMQIICLTYFTCGIMDVFAGLMRGLGNSVTPMVVSLLGACGLRVVWLYTVFALEPTLRCLYISYPVSWVVTSLAHGICFIIQMKKTQKRLAAAERAAIDSAAAKPAELGV
ncbi:MAG: MATE family efflux transporter [Clostridia bacterium]|nr:MATE family efflux transporter [Clostridia bacterium]